MVGHLNNPASIVREPPRPDMKVGSSVIHNSRGFEPGCILDRLDIFRMVRQQRLGMFDWREVILGDARGVVGNAKDVKTEHDRDQDRTAAIPAARANAMCDATQSNLS